MLISALEPEEIRMDPRTGLFKDGLGRTRFFHGLNAVYKQAPFYPTMARNGTGPCTPHHLYSLCPEEIKQIKEDWGFNMIRLGVMWEAVMPHEGTLDESYLSIMSDLVN